MRNSWPPTSKRILASDKRKSDTEFQQEVTEVINQSAFQIPLMRLFSKGEKLEVVRVLDDLLRKLRLGGRQGASEVGGCLALPAIKAALDLMHQDIAAPAVLDGRPNVPFPFGRVLHVVENSEVVAPRNLSNNLLDK